MDPTSIKQHLAQICEDLDAGRALRRPAFVAAALVAGMTLGCGEDPGDSKDTATDVPLYGVAFEEDCSNDLDDDGDELVDCADPDCYEEAACSDTGYGVPFEDDCSNEIDDDGDDLVDCDDEDCVDDEACVEGE